MHWDGKILTDIKGKEKVHRVAVIITHGNFEQILAVPKVRSGSGMSIAQCVYDLLSDYKLLDKIEGICFDTTSTNTGRLNGAAVLLEQMLDRELLHVPCRHHILEIILRDIFEVKMEISTESPNVQIFESFKKKWSKINKNEYITGASDKKVKQKISVESINQMKQFCVKKLENKKLRGDYREFLELVLIFLGGKPNDRIFFREVGPTHHARWMNKAIYALKMYLFRSQCNLTAKQNDSLRDICIFLVVLYTKAWFECPYAVSAPNHDLNFIKKTIDFAKKDKVVSERVLAKFSNHLYYLSEEALGLAFFDKDVSIEEKRKMVLALERDSDNAKKLLVKPTELMNTFEQKQLSDFVTKNTMSFFERFKIPTEFLKNDPNEWAHSDDYSTAVEFLSKIHVVNDTAERNIKLFSDYNTILTNDEKDKQYLMFVVAEQRKLYPSCTKADLV